MRMCQRALLGVGRSAGKLAALLVLVVMGVANTAGAQPTNNTCQTAIALTLNSARNGNNTNATSDILQSACSDDVDSLDVWYKFTATSAGVFDVNTIGSEIDTTLNVFGACPAANLLGCNDNIDFDMGNFDSAVVGLQLAANQTIFIRVAGWGDEEGPFVVRVIPGTVATGVCCRGVTCAANVQASACAGANTKFVSGVTLCNAAGNRVTPCCRADYNQQSGVTVQDVFDFLSAWFAGNPWADFTANGVGTPSVQSIFDYLNAWFAGGCG